MEVSLSHHLFSVYSCRLLALFRLEHFSISKSKHLIFDLAFDKMESHMILKHMTGELET